MEDKEYKHTILKNKEDLIEVSVLGDGNCFFRALSMCMKYNQENHNYYRNLVYKFIKQNKEQMSFFFIIWKERLMNLI